MFEQNIWSLIVKYIDGLVQDFSNSIANPLKLLLSCTKLNGIFWEKKILV